MNLSLSLSRIFLFCVCVLFEKYYLYGGALSHTKLYITSYIKSNGHIAMNYITIAFFFSSFLSNIAIRSTRPYAFR